MRAFVADKAASGGSTRMFEPPSQQSRAFGTTSARSTSRTRASYLICQVNMSGQQTIGLPYSFACPERDFGRIAYKATRCSDWPAQSKATVPQVRLTRASVLGAGFFSKLQTGLSMEPAFGLYTCPLSAGLLRSRGELSEP
jgi:hypothetical protein